jgi:hypothetical protein
MVEVVVWFCELLTGALPPAPELVFTVVFEVIPTGVVLAVVEVSVV